MDLINGLVEALTLQNLMFAAFGVLIGTLIGVLPGIGPLLAMTLLLPLTFQFDAAQAFIMFAGIYYGAAYGGSTTSILLNTPGETGSVITAIDGHQMALRGRAGPALATAAIGSFVAGTIGTIALTVAGPAVADIALSLHPPDFFALCLLALLSVTFTLGGSFGRGLTSLALGVGLSLIGIDSQSGQPRLTFGIPELLDGLDIVVVAVGLLAVGEVLYNITAPRRADEFNGISGNVWMSRKDWCRSWKPWLRGSAIGFPAGALPLGGSELATFFSYSLERKLSKHPEQFGKGAIEGVAGPEATNNATVSGVLVPLLTLGIPTSATAVILLVAFKIYNIQPGPALFDDHPDIVWPLIASMYIGNVLLLLLNLPMVKLWVKLLEIPAPLMNAAILVFATVGAFSLTGSVFDVMLLYVVGVVGLVMRLFGFPVLPVIMGLVLGDYLESFLRRSLQMSEGSLTVLVSSPVAAIVLTLCAALILKGPLTSLLRLCRRQPPCATTPTAQQRTANAESE